MRYRWMALVLLLVIAIALAGCCDSCMEPIDIYKEGHRRSDNPWPKHREGFADSRLDTLDMARRYFEQATEGMPDKNHDQRHYESRLFRLLVAVYLQNQAIIRDLGCE